MKRRVYVQHENLLSVLNLRSTSVRRIAESFTAVGIQFPSHWTTEKRDDFIMNFLNTTSVETVGVNLSKIMGKEMSNKAALEILYLIPEKVTTT